MRAPGGARSPQPHVLQHLAAEALHVAGVAELALAVVGAEPALDGAGEARGEWGARGPPGDGELHARQPPPRQKRGQSQASRLPVTCPLPGPRGCSPAGGHGPARPCGRSPRRGTLPCPRWGKGAGGEGPTRAVRWAQRGSRLGDPQGVWDRGVWVTGPPLPTSASLLMPPRLPPPRPGCATHHVLCSSCMLWKPSVSSTFLFASSVKPPGEGEERGRGGQATPPSGACPRFHRAPETRGAEGLLPLTLT